MGLCASCAAELTGSGVGAWVWIGEGLKILFHLLCHGQGISSKSDPELCQGWGVCDLQRKDEKLLFLTLAVSEGGTVAQGCAAAHVALQDPGDVAALGGFGVEGPE